MMFKILLFFLLINTVCKAQYDNANKRDSTKILDAKNVYHKLNIDKDERANIELPFDTIIFKDVRYDTTFFAMDYPLFRISNTYNVKENLYNGFAYSLSKYFNGYYSTGNTNTNSQLLCYIKTFAVNEPDFLAHFNTGSFVDDTSNVVNIEIECYYKLGNTLFPAVKFDTSYLHFFGLFVNVPVAVKKLLQPLMNKIEQANLNQIKQRKHYTEDSINKRYEARFNIPILTTDTYKQGIYRSFNEFKNNSPSIDSFSVSTDKIKVKSSGVGTIDLTNAVIHKRNTVVYLYDANNQLITPSEIFGYCDGKFLWIQHGSFFYPLVKTGNSFEFMYIFHYADSNRNIHTAYILMPLNMENGHSN